MLKRSRLAKTSRTGFQMVSESRNESVREMTIRKPDGPAFGCLLYTNGLQYC
jgi:hypothetical protein